MYWLLDYETQESVRQTIMALQAEVASKVTRDQNEQLFPFLGRKSREVAKSIISHLSPENGIVADPFCGSGTFGFAALDMLRKAVINEWEPYAFSMTKAIFDGVPNSKEFLAAKDEFINAAYPKLFQLYKTKCPSCGHELMFDGLFFDRDPEEYMHPTLHNRMGSNGENVIFRGSYRCHCGQSEKSFDSFDQKVLNAVNSIEVNFPQYELIENSRLNFTSPTFTQYANLFSHRQQVALMLIKGAIETMGASIRPFFMDTFISIIHYAKYVDYHTKTQDNHCPARTLKEHNLYYRFLETLNKRYQYISEQQFRREALSFSCVDFRDYFNNLSTGSIDLVLTDPPYGDTAQYFEHSQRVHPFMNYSLSADRKRLKDEVVISNAPSRTDKHSKEQFLTDIDTLFRESSRVLKPHSYFVMYFRPKQCDWISDLNVLKDMGRRYGLEPLISIPTGIKDPSMRAIASAAWTIKSDVCFVFLKLTDVERRWYEGDIDVDELIYLAALQASNNRGDPFVLTQFNTALSEKFASVGMSKLFNPKYAHRIEATLMRFCVRDLSQYRLTGNSPYENLTREMLAETRLREFAPAVIEELTVDGEGFTFEDYVIHLASYLENGSRKIIQELHKANRLVPELLLQNAYEDELQGKFFAREPNIAKASDGEICLRKMEPSAFEHLVADWCIKRGYVSTTVIGRSCDRGVDVLATNANGELELLQCKRYRAGNNVGSTAIQRIDSYMRSRHARRAWVITTSDFTSEGKDEAYITGVKTMNGIELISSLELYYPGKYSL